MGEMPHDVHTTVRQGGGLIRDPELQNGENVIDPESPTPTRSGLRYSLSHRILGRLERLAKARFYISELTSEDVSKWTQTPDLYWMIAQSVNASSEIEGEHIQADHLQLLIAPTTSIGEEHLSQEEKRRLDVTRSITDACLWALQRDERTVLTLEFVLELHERMFKSTCPDIAGRLKNKEVHIRGGKYNIRTLPVSKTEAFLKALCDRTNRTFTVAHDHAEASIFLATAEFICDFLAIHPFRDGNGRASRILSTYLLERAGYHFARFYSLEQIILETKPQYYESLYRAQRRWYQPDEDMTPWIQFYTDSVFVQWERAHQKVRDQGVRRERD